MKPLLLPVAALIVIGAAWGATQPLAKIAVSEGYRPAGLIFWQQVIGVLILGLITLARGRGLPLGAAQLRLYVVIALVGTVLPNMASFSAAVHLPSGILSILLSTIPFMALPIALLMGTDTFRWRRLIGLALGLVGVALLVLPDADLPDAAQSLWIPVALIASAFYAFEGNYVARFGTAGCGPIQTLLGASMVGAVLVLPMSLISGQFIDPRGSWGAPDYALVASSLLHAGAYAGYVWLVAAAGAVFAVQVSYFVTLFGVTWAILFLDEAYAPLIWAALGLMLAGMALVQPRPRAPLVQDLATGQNAQG